jgi:hypothetical protein
MARSKRPNNAPVTLEWLEAQVIKLPEAPGCHLWTGAAVPLGYGYVRRAGKAQRVVRVAWELRHGPIPKGKKILHTCDVPACIRDDHTYPGTTKQNTQDMLRRGRAKGGIKHMHGELHHNAKLNWAAVAEIRASSLSLTKRAKQHGVAHATIWAVVHRKTWFLKGAP